LQFAIVGLLEGSPAEVGPPSPELVASPADTRR
jgi:hypothetical protein